MYYPSQKVDRLQEQEPKGATIIEVRGNTLLLAYDEGGTGYWPTDAVDLSADNPNYRGFWDAILISQVYQAVYGIATQSLVMNTALTAFIAAFQDAKEGRPNVGAIQSCIYLVMQAGDGLLTSAHLAELQDVMDAANLSDIYSLLPPAP